MTIFISGHFNKATKTKTYQGKKYRLQGLTDGKSAGKIGMALTNGDIPNLQMECWDNGRSRYAIYTR